MLQRQILPAILQSMRLFPAIMLIGGRQVGKSTILKQLHKEGIITEILSLDQISLLRKIDADPDNFLQGSACPIGIDEVQRLPILMLAIKKNIDDNRVPGKFILTGSVNLLSYQGSLESLAGRASIIRIDGLSASEVVSNHYPFMLLQTAAEAPSVSKLMEQCNTYLNSIKEFHTNKIIDEILFYGSYPSVWLNRHEPDFRNAWFANYETAYIERDVRDLSQYINVLHYARLFQTIACRTGNLLNYQSLALDCNLDQRTAKRFIEILNITFQLSLLQPWYQNATKRVIKTPKVYLNDVGHASFVLGLNDINTLRNSPEYGNLIETFIFGELRKQIALLPGYEIYFYRDQQHEVDFIIKKGAKFIAIECKAKANIITKDLKNLAAFISQFPGTIGIILYTGEQAQVFSDNIVAIPMKIFF